MSVVHTCGFISSRTKFQNDVEVVVADLCTVHFRCRGTKDVQVDVQAGVQVDASRLTPQLRLPCRSFSP